MEKERFKNNIYSFIRLLGLYLNKKEAPDFIIEDNLVSFFIKFSKHHSLRAMLYKAIVDTKAKTNKELLNKLDEFYLMNLRKSVLFQKERSNLYHCFNDDKIEFLPLKGIILKDFYLDPHTREFADNDILFENKNSSLVRDIFIRNGYDVEEYKKGNHDVYIKKPFFNFEMHRSLFERREDNKAVVRYFENYLDKSLIKDKHERYLTNEDFYIYFTAHSYKHFSGSGCGIRTLIDYYLYLKKTKLDFEYINKELDKLGLLDFSKQISSLSLKLFDCKPLNEGEEEMFLFIASSGTYGTLDNRVERGVKEKGKFKYFMSRVFPPYSYYKMPYPWAYYFPLLIPLAWFISFLKRVFRDPKRASSELKMINKQKKQKEQ